MSQYPPPQQQPQHQQPTAPSSPLRSVAANTWGRKGVTAKQRQAALRQSRLDPLPADEYYRQQSMLSSAGNSAMNSRRGSVTDVDAQRRHELQFIRQHGLGGGGFVQDAAVEVEPPRSPLLSQGHPNAAGSPPTVKHFWSNTGTSGSTLPVPSFEQQGGPLTPPPKQFISRPARSKHLTGANSPGGSRPSDPMQVTEVLQSMRARQEASLIPTPEATPQRADLPDSSSVRGTMLPMDEAARARLQLDELARRRGEEEHDDPTDAASPLHPPPLPPPLPATATTTGLCACMPCMDSSSSLCCSSSNPLSQWCGTSSSFSLFGLGGREGRDDFLHSLRHGFILPQDSDRVNVRAVEAALVRADTSAGGAGAGSAVLRLRVQASEELEVRPGEAGIVHPFVRVHIVDITRGTYWRKADPHRHAVAPYENLRTGAAGGGEKVQETLLPIQTSPFPLRSHGSFAPSWDEILLFNEPLRGMLTPRCMALFEVVDFDSEGERPLAWAFLKLTNARGEPNIAPQARLQLFRYTNMGATATDGWLNTLSCGVLQGSGVGSTAYGHLLSPPHQVPRVYYEWLWQRHTGRVRYPSSLFVGLGGAPPPSHEVVRGARPTLPTQVEVGRVGFEEMVGAASPEDLAFEALTGGDAGRRERASAAEVMHPAARAALVRKRRSGEECMVPSSVFSSISAGPQGCFVLRHSPDGSLLAAACGDRVMFTLKVYDANSGEQLWTWVGHHDFIHDLAWNALGDKIITASADATAKVWGVPLDPRTGKILASHMPSSSALHPRELATFLHPSFVYAAAWHPKLSSHFECVTGGFDGTLRFWDARSEEVVHAIGGDSEGHQAHINSVVYAPSGTRIFTGDGEGVIKVWEDTMYTRAASTSTAAGGKSGSVVAPAWSFRIRLLHTLAHPDLVGTPISCLRFHPRPERLVVYGRDNCLWVFSLLRYELKSRLSGVPCSSHTLHACISPDGEFVVAGGEDGNAHVFSLTTSSLVQVLDVGYRAPLSDVSWHPSQHALALSSFGGDYPIKMLEFRPGMGGTQQPRISEEDFEAAQLEATNAMKQAARTAQMQAAAKNAPLPPSLSAQAASATALSNFSASTSTKRTAGASTLSASRPLLAPLDTGGDSLRRPIPTTNLAASTKRVTFDPSRSNE